MAFAVEMYFDAEADRAVRQIWQDIAEAGLKSFMLEGNYRPHISLSVCQQLDIKGLSQALEKFAKDLPALTISLGSVGIFPGEEGVVFLAATVDQALLKTHTDFYRIFPEYARHLSDYYSPGTWVPHCTLAMYFSVEEMGRALPVIMQAKLPIQARLTEIGIVEVSPTSCKELFTTRLGIQ
jgi:2'-5' RNA ligase